MTSNPLRPNESMKEATIKFKTDLGELKGYSFGADVAVSGEVVFNTGMVG